MFDPFQENTILRDEMESLIEKHNAEVVCLKSKITDLEEENGLLEKKVNDLEEENGLLEKKVNDLENEINKLNIV